MSLTDYPHLYKKGKILKFKNLNPLNRKIYVFSSNSEKPSVPMIIKHCNNINEILARVWFRLSRMGSYFGIEKDQSEKLKKNLMPYNTFWTKLQKEKGGVNNLDFIESIKRTLDHIELKIKPNLVTEDKVKEIIKGFDEKLEEIRQAIKSLVG